ncbi:hypothetical protein I3U_00180 (plasmid) [Escherichia coli O26 str. RM10386]|nr:hypothetical protein I3U_00180 [Escherichia coli O26 str. RM10386]
MFYEGSNASASGYGVTHVRDRQMAAQPQAALQETEYKRKRTARAVLTGCVIQLAVLCATEAVR